MLILSRYIAKHELDALSRTIALRDVLDGATKVKKGLAIATKPPVQGYRFYKVRIGQRNAARMIVFLITDNQKIVPILIRLKQDKVFGANMAMNNPRVVEQIRKNMEKIMEDIQAGRYEEYPL